MKKLPPRLEFILLRVLHSHRAVASLDWDLLRAGAERISRSKVGIGTMIKAVDRLAKLRRVKIIPGRLLPSGERLSAVLLVRRNMPIPTWSGLR